MADVEREIVTRETIAAALKRERPYAEKYIGRALVAIFGRQTESEKKANTTAEHNTVGFSGADGKSGTLTAKYYLKHNRLEDWQMNKWMVFASNGYPKLAKYHRQLNEIAVANLQRSW